MDEVFEAARERMLALGYRMLGSRTEAEDQVQEAWLRWCAHRQQLAQETPPDGWLLTTMARLCLDALRRRKVRAAYVGPWLPEPVVAAPPADEAEALVEFADDLSMALLLLLERLGPDERAALLLRDVFDAAYADIAATLDRSEPAVRQLVTRARRRVRQGRARFRVTPDAANAMASAFLAALQARDEDALTALLHPSATLVSDGGGRVPAALRPIRDGSRIVRFFLGTTARPDFGAFEFVPRWLNHAPGWLIRAPDGSPYAALLLETDGTTIRRCLIVRNPDKLGLLA